MEKPSSNQGPEPLTAAHDNSSAAGQRDGDAKLLPLATLAQEVELLRAEKAALRHTLDELENLLEQEMQTAQTTYDKKQQQEVLVEEKSEEIRELHRQLQERPELGSLRPSDSRLHEEELLALSEELEYERGQLREHEEALTDQMREMEVEMSRERAELARQRHELQRLHSEILHELDRATRHATLRDRLEPLERRHRELLRRDNPRLTHEAPPVEIPEATALPPDPDSAEEQPLATPAPVASAAAPLSNLPDPSVHPPAEDDNDLLRRLFG